LLAILTFDVPISQFFNMGQECIFKFRRILQSTNQVIVGGVKLTPNRRDPAIKESKRRLFAKPISEPMCDQFPASGAELLVGRF
jgi:hypothetical protein